MLNTNYVLITPAKNEEVDLPKLASCVVRQSILPKMWIIVDGGSTDGTIKLVENLSKQYRWIHLKKQEKFVSECGHINFSIGVREGYEFVKQMCISAEINYDYVGKVDADVLIPEDFFEILIKSFDEDSQLGIVSGASYTLKPGIKLGTYDEVRENDIIRDRYIPYELADKRLYRKQYLDMIGGFPESKYSPDTVLLTKFRLRGWRVKSLDIVKIYNLREDSGIERCSWKSNKLMGSSRYYLDYNPILFIIGAIYSSTNKPLHGTLAYFFGFFSSMVKQECKIDDPEIRSYFREKRMAEIINSFIDHLTKIIIHWLDGYRR